MIIKKTIHSIFIVLLTTTFALGQTASLLPNAVQQYLDQNGKPLSSGSVTYYVPNTNTLKPIWQDAAEATPWANPITLDAAGRGPNTTGIYGEGSYDQLLKDKNNNVIWRRPTAASGGSTPSPTGDGEVVGTVKAWAGFVAPASYFFAAGQEVSRATYSNLLTTITLVQNVTCSSGSNVITSLADASQLGLNTAVEAACLPAGAKVVSKTSTTATLTANAVSSQTTSATFYPWGNGNGTTTFNIPDLRGKAPIGRNNMNGTASIVLNSTYFLTDPNGLGVNGGLQFSQLIQPNVPAYTPTGSISVTLNDPGHVHPVNIPSPGSIIAGQGGGTFNAFTSTGGVGVTNAFTATTNVTGITVSSQTFTGSGNGGSSTPFSNIPPSITLNWIIKAIPGTTGSIPFATLTTAGGLFSLLPITHHFVTGLGDNNGILTHAQPVVADIADAGTMALQNANAVAITGGAIGGMPNPTLSGDVANKAYVDATATGLNILASSTLATAAVLPNTPTYANGASGVGATLTAGSNTTLTVDGTAAPLNTVVLVKNQASAFQNGVYTVTTAGSGAAAWVLTRATYFDQAAEMLKGSFTLITSGATNVGTSWILTATVTTVGTDAVNWNQFSSNTTTTVVVPPGGRLTLQSNTPVMTTSQSNKGTLYYDCYSGQGQVPYYNGTTDVLDTISSCEVSNVMVSAASAGQIVNANVYDVWWVHGGSNRICVAMSASGGGGGGWGSDTGGANITRGTGYSQLDRTTRQYITNANSIANCFNAANNYGPVSANQGTYLGTFYATANGQTSYTLGGAASGGTAGLIGIWNMYNRIGVPATVTDSGTVYTYTTATIRQQRASAGMQVSFVRGLDEGTAELKSNVDSTGVAVAASVIFGIGLDSTSAFVASSSAAFMQTQVATTANIYLTTFYTGYPGLGFHTLTALEKGDGTNANLINNGHTSGVDNNLQFSMRM